MKKAKQLILVMLLCAIIWTVGSFVPQSSVEAQIKETDTPVVIEPGIVPTGTGIVEPELNAIVEEDALNQTVDLQVPMTQTDPNQWPQVQNDPQHSGYTPQTLGTNFKVVWRKAFQPEKVFPQVQAIVQNNRVFIPTESGNVYAFDAANGAQLWVFNAGGPILNSVASGDNRVYFGSMDGSVYAVNASTGALIWKNQLSWRLGFSTAPLIADGKIMLGGRNGVFYALNPATGNVYWEYDTGSPILMTAAWNNGQVYFGAMDMRVYALASSNGAEKWVSGKIPAMAFKDYWPVIYGGYVYVRPWNKGELGVDDRSKLTDYNTQMSVLNAYVSNPNVPITMFRFRESDGVPGEPMIHYWYQTMNGAVAPPCVDRDGLFVIPAPFPADEVKTGWGRLNPTTRVLVDTLVESGNTNEGNGHGDESMAVTCTGNLILAMHIEEQNVQFTGAFNLDDRTWTHIGLGKQNHEMFTNTQGGGANPASVANGLVYHISVYELIVRSTR